MSTTDAPEPGKGSRFLTVAQGATYLNVSTAFLYGAIESDELTAHRFGRIIRVTRDELDRLAVRATERPVRGRPRSGKGKAAGKRSAPNEATA